MSLLGKVLDANKNRDCPDKAVAFRRKGKDHEKIELCNRKAGRRDPRCDGDCPEK